MPLPDRPYQDNFIEPLFVMLGLIVSEKLTFEMLKIPPTPTILRTCGTREQVCNFLRRHFQVKQLI